MHKMKGEKGGTRYKSVMKLRKKKNFGSNWMVLRKQFDFKARFQY